MNTTNTDRDELRGILDTLAYKHSCDGYIKNGDPHDIGVIPDEVTNAKRLIEALIATKVREAKIKEVETWIKFKGGGVVKQDEWMRVIAEYFRTVDKSNMSVKLLNAIDSLNWHFYDEKGTATPQPNKKGE